MSSLSRKIDFAAILSVSHANPNGDPLNGNRPRTDYNGMGEITDVCLKRKVRDRLMDAGAAIFVQSDDRKTDDATSLADRAAKGLKAAFGSRDMAAKACEIWVDVRAFGQLFAFKGAAKERPKRRKQPKIREQATQASPFLFAARSPCGPPLASSRSTSPALRSPRACPARATGANAVPTRWA